ncbi:MAG: polymer-forming cytoskeletal protein [Alphaproteobacteria bacterium]
MVGNILHESLSIEEGAFLEGHCKRMSEVKDQDEGNIGLVFKDSETAASSAPPKDASKKLVTGL